MRYVVFGDLHSNYLALKTLLKRVKYVPKEDILIFVGDYTDNYRWLSERNAKKTVQAVVDLVAESPDTVFPIRGNHDDWFDEWLQGQGTPPLIWYKQGGRETLESYYSGLKGFTLWNREVFDPVREAVPERHKAFFQGLPLFYNDDNLLVVHGGLPVFWVAEKMLLALKEGNTSEMDLRRDDILWDREWQKGTRKHQVTLAKVFGPDKILIVGHTQGKDIGGEFVSGPFRNGNIINVDSFGLHCFVLDTETKEQYITGIDDVLKL